MNNMDNAEMCSMDLRDCVNDVVDENDDDDIAIDLADDMPSVVMFDFEESLTEQGEQPYGERDVKFPQSNDNDNDNDDDDDDNSDDDSFVARIPSTVHACESQLRRHSLDMFTPLLNNNNNNNKHNNNTDFPQIPTVHVDSPSVRMPLPAHNAFQSTSVTVDPLFVTTNLLGMNRRRSITKFKAITAAHKELFLRIVSPPPLFAGDATQARQCNLTPNGFCRQSRERKEVPSVVVESPTKKRSLESPPSFFDHKRRRVSDDDGYSSPPLVDTEEPPAIVSPILSRQERLMDLQRETPQQRRGAIATSSSCAAPVSNAESRNYNNDNKSDSVENNDKKISANPTKSASIKSALRECDSPCASSSSTGVPDKTALVGAVKKPRSHDVLFGRGGHAINHEGNKLFRDDILSLRKQYRSCKKGEKQKLAEEVVTRVYKRGGRMLKCQGNFWYQVERKVARDKASQCLRETRYPPSPDNDDEIDGAKNKQ